MPTTLEQFIDETLQRSADRGYVPTVFIGMRNSLGLVTAIQRLVETSEPKSGFRRLKDLGMVEWSLEAAVIRFPSHFTKQAIAYAQVRLDGTFDA